MDINHKSYVASER